MACRHLRCPRQEFHLPSFHSHHAFPLIRMCSHLRVPSLLFPVFQSLRLNLFFVPKFSYMLFLSLLSLMYPHHYVELHITPHLPVSSTPTLFQRRRKRC